MAHSGPKFYDSSFMLIIIWFYDGLVQILPAHVFHPSVSSSNPHRGSNNSDPFSWTRPISDLTFRRPIYEGL